MVIELGGSVLKIRVIYYVIYLELKTRALHLLPNGVLLPNSAHMSIFSLYQFLVLTEGARAWLTVRVVGDVILTGAR
jgi:hypothetical protein